LKSKTNIEKRVTHFSDADRNPLIERNRAKAIRANARHSQKVGQFLVGQPNGNYGLAQ